MFDLKDTAVFMYKAAKHRYIYFYVGWFWRSKCNKSCKRKNFVQNFENFVQ